ncbi:SulP family inorganic anion transporter [Lewinella sp. 4G2]|uniref:SulP family inorganic anion transporter n=1 Tax=Lewinella sp. 4G2 TaxID=1803372 RepID=UPI0007B49506|nr:SulP family inorganic anion transporter [Lewinella sp. 4G2]OAV45232.1 sodium-independent anion transporter [Lewinella sp. 4G2]
MTKYLNLFDFSQEVDYRTEILSGLTVALALIPEAVAFALIAGLDPLIGLYAAFVMGLVTAVLGGRPGMISGATGAVAVVIAPLVTTLVASGMDNSQAAYYVFAAIILAGLLQVLAGVLRLGKLMRLVPHPVVFGFVNGLAIIIFTAQLGQFKTDTGEWATGMPLFISLALVGLVMFIMWGLPKISKAVPSGLVGILVVFAIVVGFDIDTKTVGDIASIEGGFPMPAVPEIAWSFDTLKMLMPYALVVALVGLIESLLTLNIVDEITETRGRGNKEAVAQGLGNILSGFTGGMGGCAMIGQSLINISSGARARLSGIFAAIMLLIFIMFGASLIERLPMAALTGIMIMVAIGTFEWASLKTFGKMPKWDLFVMVLVTVITIVIHNLAYAVIAGVVVASLVFAYENAKMIRARKRIEADGSKVYEIYGPLFFGSVQTFNTKFDVLGDPDNIVIDFMESRVVDMSAIEALNRLTERYEKVGKHVTIKHLSPDSRRLLNNAEDLIDINVTEDPTYKVMTDFE